MDLIGACGIFCIVASLLFAFISLITTSWFTFSLNGSPTHYYGLYQSCTVYGCKIDWTERTFHGQVVLFLMVGSTAMLLVAAILTVVAQMKSRKFFLLIAAPFSTAGGCLILGSATLYTIMALSELENGDLVGIPAFFYGYGLAWAACGLSLIGAVLMFVNGCRDTNSKTMVEHL